MSLRRSRARCRAAPTSSDPSNIPLALLLRHLPVVEQLSTANGGVIAIVGPDRRRQDDDHREARRALGIRTAANDLALVSTDANRIGAREQLMTYARMLGAPIHAANGHTELARLLDSLKSKRLVLIDTAGHGTPGVAPDRAARHAQAERRACAGAAGAAGAGETDTPSRRSSVPSRRVSPAACILTKVDEAMSLGAVLSTTLRHQLKIAYLCDGRRVPENLYLAHQRRLWLVLAAHDLKERAQSGRDLAYLAGNSNRAPAHA